MKRLNRDFFRRDTAKVAKSLLGKTLVRQIEGAILRGRIVETEAYYGEGDPPSHASSGKTPRSEIMWSNPGLVYVYLVYGIHRMVNIVAEEKGTPGAVLLRAVEPLEGIDKMVKNREGAEVPELTSGPGKLTEAFKIRRKENGVDLVTSENIWLEPGPDGATGEFETSGRIGVSEGEEEQLRFYLAEDEFVSGT